jgi:hypothetical protein
MIIAFAANIMDWMIQQLTYQLPLEHQSVSKVKIYDKMQIENM